MSIGNHILAGITSGLVGGLVLSIIELGGMKTRRIPTPLIVAMQYRLEDKLNIAERSTHGQKVRRSQIVHFLTTGLYGLAFGAIRGAVRQRARKTAVNRIYATTGGHDTTAASGMPEMEARYGAAERWQPQHGYAVPVTGQSSTRQSLPVMVLGPLFGLAVFLTMLGGVMPALGLSRPVWRMNRTVALRELALHLLFGSVTAAVYDRLTWRK